MSGVNRNWYMAVAILLLVSLLAAPRARADSVLIKQSTMISGTFSGVYSFSTTQSGTLDLRLENIAWPERLAALSCNLYDNQKLLGSLATTGELHIDLAGPGTYFTHLFAQASSLFDLGLFSLNVSFRPSASAVPLPAGVWLLASVLGWFGVRRCALPFLKFTLGRATPA